MSDVKVPLRCECSSVQGHIYAGPLSGNNIVCCCCDCQSFMKFLGKSEKYLTKNLGTELYQVTPNKLEITQGADKLACVQLTKKGINRWYTKCCNTPVANTLGAKVAFNGVAQAMMDFDTLDMKKEEVLGPVALVCMTKYAVGDLPKNSHKKFPLGITLKILKMILKGFLFKTYLPSAFFSFPDGVPIAKPLVLSESNKG